MPKKMMVGGAEYPEMREEFLVQFVIGGDIRLQQDRVVQRIVQPADR